jgi:hypothetical protein
MQIDLITRLHSQTNISNGHWLWKNKNKTHPLGNRPGVILIGKKIYTVNRLGLSIYLKLDYNDHSWEACHICEHKNCWNPLHNYPGTHKDNMNDRYNVPVVTIIRKCRAGHELTPDNIVNHASRIRCKTCRIKHQKVAGANRLRRKSSG